MNTSKLKRPALLSAANSSLVAVGLSAIALVIAYVWAFRGSLLPPDKEHWGQMGDFFGGILNPLVAGAALFWLTRSVNIQKAELADTRAELERATAAQNAAALLSALGTLHSSKLSDFLTLFSKKEALEKEIQQWIADAAAQGNVVNAAQHSKYGEWEKVRELAHKASDGRRALEMEINELRAKLAGADEKSSMQVPPGPAPEVT